MNQHLDPAPDSAQPTSSGHRPAVRNALKTARFAPGDIVRHRMFDFRGVVFDVDPEFANSEEWYEAIPEAIRPSRQQPFYHLFAENEDSSYIAYVSQQNLLPDGDSGPVDHPQIAELFDGMERGRYRLRPVHRH